MNERLHIRLMRGRMLRKRMPPPCDPDFRTALIAGGSHRERYKNVILLF